MHHPVRGPLDIRYRDADVIVVDKPAGLAVIPDRATTSADTLTNRLWYHLDTHGGGRPLLVHRLDRATSGLVVFALAEEAQRRLTAFMARGKMIKRYLAVVAGQVGEVGSRRTVTAPLAEVRRRGRTPSVQVEVTDGGRPAETRLVVVSSTPEASLLDVQLVTGRRHQIRVHLAHLGHPIFGDPLYGPPAGDHPLCLHSWRLVFPSPSRRGLVEVTAPVPGAFARVVASCGLQVPLPDR